MYYEIFADLCKTRKVTPADVSRGTGIATSTLTNWKKGNYTPKADKLQKIADYFGVTLAYMTGVEDFEHQEGYYLNPEAARLAQKLFDDPKYRILFSAAEDCTPEDLQIAADMLLRLKEARRD